MKAVIVIVMAVGVALAAWWLASPENRSNRSDETYRAPTSHPPTTTLTDATDVFQKAFWKRPTTDDHILHAERREWADAQGVQKWQWFIAVKPSMALIGHLITDNAFLLTAAASGGDLPSSTPHWFPAEAPQTFVNATGTFRILWDQENQLLHATDSGTGFRPGAPEPVKPITATQPAGRLPTTPPPKP